MDAIHYYMKRVVKLNFPKYKKIQVAATLTEMEILQREIVSEKRIFGILVHREFEYKSKIIPLQEFNLAYRRVHLSKMDRNLIYVAVDENNKTVYWNYVSLPDEIWQ